MSITLHKSDGSPPARAAMMITELLKLKHERVDVNVMGGDHLKPEYLQKNPNHSVPMLDDNGFIVADSHVILTYLVEKYGQNQAQLYPKDIALRATVDQRLFFEASNVFGAIRALISLIMQQQPTEPSPEVIQKVNEAYKTLEAYLSKTKYVACDHLTVADISLASSISSLNGVIPIDAKYGKLRAWLSSLENEEWYKKGNAPGLAMFTGFINSVFEKNAGKA
ncbi:glutathione S-transferase 1-like [Trichoplusia ni]|uniref:Glutathione S-transferase 1-like n=1 Tax=Trichoplusia ni TaxID=7111 RepID=A0A7E5WTY3_TRINI|nr:glutathione S-transferase 1-like [Trichoplusia ni]